MKHACWAILGSCVDSISQARSNADNLCLRSNALEEVKESLNDLWRLRTERESQFAELVNAIQLAFFRREVEDFTDDELGVLEAVFTKLRDEPRYDDDFANGISLELMRGGVDVFRALD